MTSLVITLLRALQMLMFFSAIISWIPSLRGSKLQQMLYMLTEPIVMPFRKLLQRIPSMQRMRIDLSFLFAYLTLAMLEMLMY